MEIFRLSIFKFDVSLVPTIRSFPPFCSTFPLSAYNDVPVVYEYFGPSGLPQVPSKSQTIPVNQMLVFGHLIWDEKHNCPFSNLEYFTNDKAQFERSSYLAHIFIQAD